MGEVAKVAAKSTRGTPAQWWQLVKGAASAWIDDYAPSMGAALSYYTVFSLAPLLLIVVSIAGLVFGEEAARGEIFGQVARADGRRCRQGDRGPAGERQQAGRRRRRDDDRRRPPADRRHHGLRRAAGRARPDLARAGARALRRLVEAAARAAALVRHDPRHRLPADGLAGAERGDLRARQVVGRLLRRLGNGRPDRQLRDRLPHDRRRVRDDLQDHAAGAGALARRLARRGRDRGAVHASASS